MFKGMVEKRARQSGIESVALYSNCGAFRYGLSRHWAAEAPELLYVMLNPSTATEEVNDATIERCQRRAVQLGFGGMRIANLFAFRATKPADLRKASDPVGPLNDALLEAWSGASDMTLAAWGVHGSFQERDKVVARRLQGKVCHLGVTKHGIPRHPLYVSYATQPQLWVRDKDE